MRTLKPLAVLAFVAAATSASAQNAGSTPESEALGNCFVMKSTGADRLALVRWFSGALLGSPKTADLARVDPAKREQSERQVAEIFTRLFTKDCLTEAKAVAKSGNASLGFKEAGGALGRIAFSELLSDTATEAAMSGFAKYLSNNEFKALEAK